MFTSLNGQENVIMIDDDDEVDLVDGRWWI